MPLTSLFLPLVVESPPSGTARLYSSARQTRGHRIKRQGDWGVGEASLALLLMGWYCTDTTMVTNTLSFVCGQVNQAARSRRTAGCARRDKGHGARHHRNVTSRPGKVGRRRTRISGAR